LGEELTTAVQKFMNFYSTQWSILGNLFQASSALHNLQCSTNEFDAKFEKGQADITETIALTISTFNDIISKIEEYREVSQDAFDFLVDDLKRAISISEQIAKAVAEGYSAPAKDGIVILKSKLAEITDKVNKHLKVRKKEG